MKKKKQFSYAKYGYIFCLPFTIAFLIFSLYPTVYTAVIGFTDLHGLTMTNFHFLTDDPFKNFRDILNNATFLTSLKNTCRIWVSNFIPQILLALLLTAWYSDPRTKLKGQGFFKVMFYMPNIITAASIAILFKALFDYPMSPANDIIQTLGLSSGPVNLLINKTIARGVVAFIQFWMWYGYTTIILISGVLGISTEIFEAAAVDGANRVQTFFLITLPNLKTILLFTLVTSLIGGLNMFDIPKLFLLGGPDNSTLTTSVFIYNQAFSGGYLYNRAAAASMIMFVIISVCAAILFYLLRDRDEAKLQKEIRKQKKLMKGGARYAEK
ncbi:MAG: sugar ABC transporter permease [Lachnospiraceae bacterium]|nr:sugar ABC transporter permease [Lachnospiraceae bacterium]MCI1726180.1 sugar ABC transporter permease [Lachnospiraceae bacterium]